MYDYLAYFGLGLTYRVWLWFIITWMEEVGTRARSSSIPTNIGSLIIAIILTALFIVVAIVTLVIDFAVATVMSVVWFFVVIVDIFNARDDDAARDLISRLSCEQINRLTNNQLDTLTRVLLDGPTGDDDEEALIKIVQCLECDRLRDWYWPRHGQRIREDTHGSEYDRLRASLYRCDLSDPTDWDDDVTRWYIRDTPRETLARLTLEEVKVLLRNLFDGATGDADERAIIRLISSLPPERVQALVREPGFSVSDFDSEVDGDEWDWLVRVFREKGVRV